MDKSILIGVSPRHVHPSKEHFVQLFGENAYMVRRSDLTQGGQFAAEQTVTLSTSLGKIELVRILGPVRKNTQVEISHSDAVLLGLNPPVRDSGDHEGTPGITIMGPAGVVQLEKGVIIAQRHIHMTPTDAREFGVSEKELVWVAVKPPNRSSSRSEGRGLIFGDVLVRIDTSYKLDFHLDTDEANAAGVQTGDSAFLIKNFNQENQPADDLYPAKRLYSEWDVRQAKAEGKAIIISKNTILTPSAKDYGRLWNIFRQESEGDG